MAVPVFRGSCVSFNCTFKCLKWAGRQMCGKWTDVMCIYCLTEIHANLETNVIDKQIKKNDRETEYWSNITNRTRE